MKYISTRDSKVEVSASQAIVNGISSDGGLFVPSSFPTLDKEEIIKLTKYSYPERAAYVMAKYLDDFTYEELLGYAEKAYSRFEDDEACPLVGIDEGLNILELWHGPTHAFKDMALTIMPYLMTAARKKVNLKNKSLILVATSGDTGKAALEGYKDVENTDVMVFYPNEGVSPMQKLQMQTQKGDNVYVGAIKGNFDDAQTAVKNIFADADIKKQLDDIGYSLSSANSINWGRLVPQIAYYVSAYVDLYDAGAIELGEKINFTVPTGNFGNILAGFYAMKMGLPVNKFICASNQNKVLTDFFISGKYDINREFHKTSSPSMDILISSNLERLLFEINGRDSEKVKELMSNLKENGHYTVDRFLLRKEADCFAYGFADEDETLESINIFFETYGYLLDPHTAVAMHVYDNYLVESNDECVSVIVSTASPYKFPQDVYYAISKKDLDDAFKASKKLRSMSALDIPEDLADLENAEVRFNDVYEIEELKKVVVEKLNGK